MLLGAHVIDLELQRRYTFSMDKVQILSAADRQQAVHIAVSWPASRIFVLWPGTHTGPRGAIMAGPAERLAAVPAGSPRRRKLR
ncbi:hypothetical protein GCM10010166_06380 [Couchioplanes caeruleus subsp. azureus]|nr:hypothetical protein GCM10010166_06380 [Couchioplanes caeruleus subsp. azureus]